MRIRVKLTASIATNPRKNLRNVAVNIFFTIVTKEGDFAVLLAGVLRALLFPAAELPLSPL